MYSLASFIVAGLLLLPAWSRACSPDQHEQDGLCCPSEPAASADAASRILRALLTKGGYPHPERVQVGPPQKPGLDGYLGAVVLPRNTGLNPTSDDRLVLLPSFWGMVVSRHDLVAALAHEAVHILREHEHDPALLDAKRSAFRVWSNRINNSTDPADEQFMADNFIPLTQWEPFQDKSQADQNKINMTIVRFLSSPEGKAFAQGAAPLRAGHEREADLLGCELAFETFGAAWEPVSLMCTIGRVSSGAGDIHGSARQRMDAVGPCVRAILRAR